NTSTQTQNVIIDDVTAPVADAATLVDITAECEVTTLTPPTATDNCAASVTVTHDATLPISIQGTTVVTWTYDDGHGNTATQTQNVIINDVTAPVADAATLADITAECEVTTLTPPTATDNCAAGVTVTHDATLPIATQGTTVVTWTYDDGHGNTSTQTQNVIIDDVTAPVADAATLVDITAECEVTTLTPPTATDNCASSVTVTHDAALPISTQGTTIVTWIYDDGHGNMATQTQNVIIDDVTAPVADAATLADITAECEVTTLTPPTATDNCSGSITVTHDATLPISTQGTTVVTWTYDDGNGNTSTQTQNIIINDVTAPVADAATLVDITAECEVTTLTPPTATDNCAAGVTVTHDATLPISIQGTTVVTWTYDDGHGNTFTQTQNVIIDDVTAP
ncbi:HYR-like domain-containing protein, partial [Winogradskyella sediminis]|uniref:HYR-like domain-containing protein n=1 Tax=Winogradskyella sediminis TaxID=1382466 RepID=UPI003744730A